MGSGTAEPSSLERIVKSNSLKLAGERHKPVIKKFTNKKLIRNLKIIYGE